MLPERLLVALRQQELVELALAGLGFGLGAVALAVYATAGYSTADASVWLLALVVLGVRYLRLSPAFPRLEYVDVLLPLGVMAAFAPFYLLRLYELPVQVGSDEIVIATVAKFWAAQRHVDLFGLSTYFGHPTVFFVVWGKLGELLGGVDLQDMRLLHALVGLLTVGLSYAFFRQLLPRPWATFAAVVFGASHAWLMISRMAMHDDANVFVEVIALTLLLLGLRYAHPFATFSAGVAAGAGFYVHFAGRSVALVIAAYLLVLAIWLPRDVRARLLRHAAAAAAGLALVATPYLIAYVRAPPQLKAYQRQALFIYASGRAHQQAWVSASSQLAGYAKNVELGLTAFNRPIADQGNLYPNPGHGFVDPVTGVLLWLGAGAVLLVRVRRRREPWPLLGLVGFGFLWLLFAFVVNEAPNYTRMLVMLPLVAYLTTEGVRVVAPLVGRLVRRSGPGAVAAVAAATLLTIVAWNGLAARDFLRAGRRTGDAIGSTGRYVQAHNGIRGVRFYLAADDKRWPYYVWINDTYRLHLFVASDRQVGGMIAPRRLASFAAAPPFAIFMNRALWERTAHALRRRYPRGRVRDVTPDGRLVVFALYPGRAL